MRFRGNFIDLIGFKGFINPHWVASLTLRQAYGCSGTNVVILKDVGKNQTITDQTLNKHTFPWICIHVMQNKFL